MSQRSPVIFWLLTAATLGVYAVACAQAASHPFPTPAYVWTGFDALNFSMLSLACIWSMFCPRKSVWSRIAPVVVALIVPMIASTLIHNWGTIGGADVWRQFRSLFPVYGLYVALLVFLLWGLRRTSFWQRRFGRVQTWQFSMAELLIVMTTVAILTAGIRFSPINSEMGGEVVAMIACTVILAVSSVVAWSLSLHWIIRFSGTMGVAVLLGWAFGGLTERGSISAGVIGTAFLIEAVVLSVWLGIGGILPVTTDPSGGDGSSPRT